MMPLRISLTDNSVLGVGTDLVDVDAFQEQMNLVGSKFASPGVLFTSRELRRASARAESQGDTVAEHLAAVWAIKEAALKAWVAALEDAGQPLPLKRDAVNWAQLTVQHSPAGAPQLQLTQGMLKVFEDGLGTRARWHVSASHDGQYALGFAVLTAS